jgi:uncharacterized protein
MSKKAKRYITHMGDFSMETLQSEAEILASLSAEVERRFVEIGDLAHGWEHVQRVYTTALDLAEREGANHFIVGVAALMHDLGRTVDDDEETPTHHADLSVILARELLTDYQVPIDVQEAILHAIAAHSFSRGVQPLTVEARVVRDADRLDGLGAIGIVRWAITGALRSNPQTKTYHPTDPFAWQHTPDDRLYMLDHFFTKLLRLQDSMATETGRILAQRRTNFMKMYLVELQTELTHS